MNQKTALLVVERDFNHTHIGVRRVIRQYWHQLSEQGYAVTLATPTQGYFSICPKNIADLIMAESKTRSSQPVPTWTSTKRTYKYEPAPSPIDERKSIKDLWEIDCTLTQDDFDLSILTTPWMCSEIGGVPAGDYSIGIVYDMIPNLLSLGVLRMPKLINIYEFAHHHSVGYDFYLQHVKKIVCISESTKQDFLSIYGSQHENKLVVSIPFSDFGNGTVKQNNSNTILLINVLDHRKNFATVANVVKSVGDHINLNVIVVGKERMPMNEVNNFLNEISDICGSVEWYRSPDDSQLELLMEKSKILFFPSIYEGLGLPILEAQAKGLPVVSSNNSSCAEINLNPQMTAAPYDHDKFHEIITSVLNHDLLLLSGNALRSKQLDHLKILNRIPTE